MLTKCVISPINLKIFIVANFFRQFEIFFSLLFFAEREENEEEEVEVEVALEFKL